MDMLTRRAALSGAAFAGIAIVGTTTARANPSAISVDRAAWDTAVAARDQAFDAWQPRQDAFERAEGAFFANRNPATSADYDRADDENGHFSAKDTEARLALNDTPAPNLTAAIHKLEQAAEWDLPLAPVISDLRRLAKMEG